MQLSLSFITNMAPVMSFPENIKNFKFDPAIHTIDLIDPSEYVEFHIHGVNNNCIYLFRNDDFDEHVLPPGCMLAMVTFNVPENDEFTVYFLLDSNYHPLYGEQGLIYALTSENENPFAIEDMMGYAVVHLGAIIDRL